MAPGRSATSPQLLSDAVPAPRPAPPEIQHVRRRRRTSGEPPPLPRHLNASGKWWLGLSAMVLVAWIVILATGTVTVFDLADTRILQAIAAVRTPWLTQVAHVAGVLAPPTAFYVVCWRTWPCWPASAGGGTCS